MRTGEMSTSRIEELAEQIGRCGPVDISTLGGRTIHCQGGTLLRFTTQGRTILISKKVPVPTAVCATYPSLGQSNAIKFEVSATRSAWLDGLHLSHDTPLERVLRAGCTSDSQRRSAGGGTSEVRCGGAKLLFAPDGRTLRTIIPPRRP